MRRNKGFTLAELLVVVAIIGILVAVSIPIFSGQLEKSRRAVDMANARNIKSVLCTALNDGTLEMGDGAKLAVCIQKSAGPVLYVQGTLKLNGRVLYDNNSKADQFTLKNMSYSGKFAAVGDMIRLLNQAVGDVLKLKVKANRFITKNKTESDIVWYAVRLTSDGTCRYGKGSVRPSSDILNDRWMDEEF